ncbi:sigma-54-dependent transcriptional regulator [Halodesulfovibrio marinisediminis]|uniref:DNA-binding transcriptional response regulator, NtrC family, contains REC, AAA-type ATPase, and a Fis-type DNA-binding domains n=1 Tax=Halodesulfovibrio marinisediminis DSM 17456 TaxID=1121457 RepID=A0A1N6DX93_9BACT|nr:sigma-54 dependent transcriptional regulator [Halodesulfovibrio marinisediminis]SIN75333.1 DNA-binding transcriptional response regulator, NtrC family, contains REC, AAA-type ATPase, and a Fis-type DNA-binding domains [Halodesulfovibrio marinisediminis DSM 17456]
MQEPRILIAEDEIIARENLAHTLTKLGGQITAAENGNEALASLEAQEFDVVLTDLKMPDIDGIELLHHIKSTSPDTEVIVLTGYATVNSAVDAMDKGAFRYIAKPIRLDEVTLYVQQALEKKRLKEEVASLRKNFRKGTDSIIGHSQSITNLKQQIDQIAPVNCTVLIHGETGTGKELVAKALHVGSPKCDNKFVAVNCASFNEELLANELFGHEKSAFTGAGSVKKGLFEVADGGTFFLDEIGEMPLSMQANLLRVLETRKLLRVGGTTEIPVDVRIIAATNRNLQEMVEQGTFRRDLYYRLNILTLEIPPLNQRTDDIPLLASFFANKFATLFDKTITEIDDDVLTILNDYPFPGNVRELENLMQRAVVLCNGKNIRAAHLPPDLQQTFVTRLEVPTTEPIVSLEENERNHLRRVLKYTNNNKSHAAKLLGLNRGSLWRKMKRFGLDE